MPLIVWDGGALRALSNFFESMGIVRLRSNSVGNVALSTRSVEVWLTVSAYATEGFTVAHLLFVLSPLYSLAIQGLSAVEANLYGIFYVAWGAKSYRQLVTTGHTDTEATQWYNWHRISTVTNIIDGYLNIESQVAPPQLIPQYIGHIIGYRLLSQLLL